MATGIEAGARPRRHIAAGRSAKVVQSRRTSVRPGILLTGPGGGGYGAAGMLTVDAQRHRRQPLGPSIAMQGTLRGRLDGQWPRRLGAAIKLGGAAARPRRSASMIAPLASQIGRSAGLWQRKRGAATMAAVVAKLRPHRQRPLCSTTATRGTSVGRQIGRLESVLGVVAMEGGAAQRPPRRADTIAAPGGPIGIRDGPVRRRRGAAGMKAGAVRRSLLRRLPLILSIAMLGGPSGSMIGRPPNRPGAACMPEKRVRRLRPPVLTTATQGTAIGS
mmetsp:Transcript_93701/g.201070  ORF Transcript_93701/g.201070 Transcript_93701/m.201070 type:complete len:275 (-) Transcript_93701:152-976(-)